MNLFENLFAFLFKYRPSLFEQGRLVLRPPIPGAVVLVVAALVAAIVVFTYWRARGKASRTDRLVLAGVRIGVVGLLAFALLRPTLLLSSVVPQQNYLGILIDDSRSMSIADGQGEPRGERTVAAFTQSQSALLRALREKFQLRYYRFSGQARRFEPGEPLAFEGGATRVAPALAAARADLGSLPLSGLVLVTDGADNAAAGLSETLLSLKASGVPVFTVGVGDDRFARDVELTRVTVPRTALQGSALVVDLMVSQTGFGGRTVPLQVEDGGRIIASQNVELPREGEPGAVRVSFTLDEPGPRQVRFRIPAQDGELLAENNEQVAVIVVRSGKEKILYVEGEPRWELKFLRRAVAADSNLQVVALQRTAPNKYLRLDVSTADELFGGFPRTREELFQYRALVLGSIEASYFSHDQLQMIADFVAVRGGGLLVLGGRSALAEGGYAGTPVADVLPIELDGRWLRDTLYYTELKVQPTRAGLAHAATRLWSDADASARWEKLPALSSVNHVGAIKPGATALLTGRRESGEQVVLAFQRYGRGLALALPVQDTWLWQMSAEIPLEDNTHEQLWRQLLRWLVSEVPDQLVAATPADHASPGEPVRINASIADDRFLRVNDSRVAARVTTPLGASLDVPLDWTLDQDGEYRGTFTPSEPGMYEIRVRADRAGGATAESAPAYVNVAESRSEYFGAQRRQPLLRRIADETGGRYYDAAAISGLAEDVTYAGRGVTVPEERELWDMPVLLLAALLLLAGEWTFRRVRSLA